MEDINLSQTTESPILPDMDSLLGSLGSENEQTVDTTNSQIENTIEVDPRFSNLEPNEAKYRTMQARHDKLDIQLKKLEPELAEKIKYEQFLSDLMTDDELLTAFLSERKPELVQTIKQDISTTMNEKLVKEFGDYQPDEDELRFAKPGSKAWLYQKKAEEIYNDLKTGINPKRIETVKELKERKARELQEQEANVKLEMDNVKNAMKWNDSTLNNFTEWANKLAPIDLAKTYEYLSKLSRMKGTSIANVPAQQDSQYSSERNKFLQSLL